MNAIPPYVRTRLRREAYAKPPTPLSPNAAWLDSAAAYWVSQPGVMLHWVRNYADTGYTGFYVVAAEFGTIAQVWIYE
jgi:hypothetical protein